MLVSLASTCLLPSFTPFQSVSVCLHGRMEVKFELIVDGRGPPQRADARPERNLDRHVGLQIMPWILLTAVD